jgi:hypothetical protein
VDLDVLNPYIPQQGDQTVHAWQKPIKDRLLSIRRVFDIGKRMNKPPGPGGRMRERFYDFVRRIDGSLNDQEILCHTAEILQCLYEMLAVIDKT